MKNLYYLPDNLPIPVDDDSCNHLKNMQFPSLKMETCLGNIIDISTKKGVTVIFFYPMTGGPQTPPMSGWNELPGARGCTPQTCSYRDNHSTLVDLNITTYGASSQPLEEQKEAYIRLNLPYELLNDSSFALTTKLNLPTFEHQGLELIKRLTIIIIDGQIKKVFYPVFPPNKNVKDVITWVNNNKNHLK